MDGSTDRTPQVSSTPDECSPPRDGNDVPAPSASVPRNRLLGVLEQGPLRDELARGDERIPDRDVVAVPSAAAAAHRLRFTGDGREYFRIWIVNLLLTLGSLGLYAPWARVRKLRYFRQNTTLDGHAFDFHGQPLPMLLGRIVALALLGTYVVAVEASLVSALAVMALLAALGPWLFLQAQRFRLGNTSWRGLRFRFQARAADAYRAVLPPMGAWFAAVLLAQAMGRVSRTSAGTSMVGLAWPWIHHRLKAFQHAHAAYGDRRFGFAPALGDFYAIYFKCGFVGLVPALAAFVVALLAVTQFGGPPVDKDGEVLRSLVAIAIGIATLAITSHAYLVARLQKTIWAQTRLAGVSFSTDIAAWPLFRLLAKNAILTILTAGFYWPFAAVAVARYRVEAFSVGAQGPLEALVAGTSSTSGRGAAGDAAVEAFGIEVGL